MRVHCIFLQQAWWALMKFFYYYLGCPRSYSWMNTRFWKVTCDFCTVDPCGFWRSFTWKALGTIVLGKICFMIPLGGCSSYSGLIFPCVIHKDDIGFTPWLELNMKILHDVLEQYLSWISCTYLLSILDFQSFTLHVK